MPPLVATYRLQFHRGFTLRDACQLVPYLAELGVSHIYASPLLTARCGSTHGYDVCDPTTLNPELGTESDLAKLVQDLRARNMGLVLDIVPNHMSTGPQNPWWWDILKHGRASRYAKYFDIDWQASANGAAGKVVVPILGKELPRVLQQGQLRLVMTKKQQIVLQYFEHQFPVSPESAKMLGAATEQSLATLAADRQALGRFLELQHYQLAFWRSGDRLLNYRRFFNIAELAGVRVEDPQVFADTHSRILQWYRDQLLDGLRIDHPDGLYDPAKYLDDLRKQAPGAWLVVEKILSQKESLPAEWPVQGTTGYDFLNRLSGLFVDPSSEGILTAFYREFADEPRSFDAVEIEKKRLVLQTHFGAELSRLQRVLQPVLTEPDAPKSNDGQVHEALVELAACFPVYRTYAQAETGVISETDVQHITAAATRACENRADLGPVLDFVRDLLLLRKRAAASAPFVMLFQQLTGPAMAKGVEDTAFYCFNRFVALNEVGGNPGEFGMTLQDFHDSCRQAQRSWPLSMLASSTHDTKRSEDVRARLILLSEIPDEWRAAVRRWSARLEGYRDNGFPDRNTEYLFYQTLVGAWPLSRERALAYMRKATREAKEHTSWSEPQPEYEKAIEHFVTGALEDREFVADLEQFLAPLIEVGCVNSLAQTLVKLTAPGIPDIYQGTELLDLSLVDPDNRRPVDFALRQRLLEALPGLAAEEVWRRRAEGLPKLWVIWRTLLFRTQQPELFGAQASYEPLIAEGERGKHVLAFMRGGKAVTVTPRLVLGVRSGWSDTRLTIPVGLWQNELTSETIRAGTIQVSELLSRFPVALLTRVHD